MLKISIILFALSAVLGLSILIKWITNKSASKAVIYSHGIAAVIALLALIAFFMNHPVKILLVSIILFAIAAVAGLYMFLRDIKNRPSPLALAFTHALVALGGFVVLMLFAFG
jgi:hypothetical protein